ncbi:MAG: preprotein translocase subunit YajC [Omnitrophica bacterium GWA2_52_8]|nr:MAG: preprotein translocase subunit YajC [Omnitrophica bacterium GWA2_52_8]
MFQTFLFAQAAAAPGQPNPIISFMPLILIFFVMYFLMIRPQQKRQKELQSLVNNLKKGDKVITAGGILGVVTSIQNDYIVVKTGENDQTKMEVLKSAVTGLRKE